MSDSVLQVLGFATFPNFSEIEQFYGYIIQYVMMALLVYAITLGLNTFLKEEKEGTIEFLYAQPITRRQLILSKLWGNIRVLLNILAIVIGLSLLTIFIFVPENIEFIDVLMNSIPVFAMMIAVTFMFLLLGTGLSLLLKSEVSTTGVGMFVVFGPYVLGMMAQMVDALKSFEFISILHTTMPSRIYDGSYDILSYVLWGAVSTVIFAYGIRYFEKRNIEV